MALSQPYLDDEADINLPNAYWRIVGLTLRWQPDTGSSAPSVPAVPRVAGAAVLLPTATIDVGVFATAATAGNAAKRAKMVLSYPVPTPATRLLFGLQATPNPVLPVERAYLYLKTLDAFSGAVDV